MQKDNEEGNEESSEIIIPELRNRTIGDAKKELKELGLELQINQETEENLSEKVIINQVPLPGIKVNNGSKVYVDIE